MSDAKLADDLYIHLTPAGCYYAASSTGEDPARLFLRALLSSHTTPALNTENLQALMLNEDVTKCIALLERCQKIGWVQGIKEPLKVQQGKLEEELPDLLNHITEDGKVILADDQGFYLASHGYPHEVAEELSALSAEISVVHQRRTGLLMKNLGLNSHAWAVVNAAGHSQLGFWPLFIGHTQFFIVLSGIPHFNQPEFTSLIWMLSVRYAKNH